MANEIGISIQVSVNKNGAGASGSYAGNTTMAGDQFIGNVQIVGTSNEAILLGDVTTTGMGVFLKNLDPTNYIEIFSDSGNTNLITKIGPGLPSLIYPNAAIYGRANTAAVNLQVVAFEA